MKATLRERLVRIEQQFLLAFAADDEETLTIFSHEWSQLAHDIRSHKVVGELDEDTTLLLSQVSRVIDGIACCTLECWNVFQEAHSGSVGHFVLDALRKNEQYGVSHRPQEILPYHLLFSTPPSATAPGILGQQKLLDSYAYHWLMQNIHNPYPTFVQMQTLADVSRASVGQVELWFQEIRDEIGWTKLSRECFAGSIDATAAAARQVYLEGDMNLSFDVIFAFTSVKSSAQKLFSVHPAFQVEHADEAGSKTFQRVGLGLGDPSETSDTFSGLSINEESELEDTTPPPSVAGRKRRLAEDTYMSQVQGPEKRLRTSTTSDSTLRISEDSPCSCPIETLPFEPITTPSPDETPIPAVTVAVYPPYPINSEPSLSPPAFVSHKREREVSECSSDPPRATRRQKLSDTVSPSSPEQLRHPRVIPESDSLLASDRYLKPFPNDTFPTNSGFDPSMLQVPIDFCPRFDLVNVHDWSKMPKLQGEIAPLMSQPISIYVPGSDLPSLDPTLPEEFEAAQSTSSWGGDPGSLEDLHFLLQYPESTCSGQSMSSPTSLYSDTPLSLLGNDFGVFSQPDSSQSQSSLSRSSNTPAPHTPDNSTLLSSVVPFRGTDTDESAFIWDSSTPPSDILPGLFHDTMLTPDLGFLATLQVPLC